MSKIKVIATAYDTQNSCEYIELDETFNILVRKTIDKIKNASTIIRTKNGFAISEEDKLEGKMHLLNEKLELQETVETGVSGIVYLDYQIENDTIWGASYTTGEFFSFNNGVVNKYKEGGTESRLHCIKNINGNIYSVNCGEDSVYFYKSSDGKIRYNNKFQFEKNVKPRHLFENNGFIYVICENSNEIYVFNTDSFGNFIFLNKYSTMLKNNLESYASTMYFNENKLYSLNRGKNTVAIFNILDNGGLNLTNEVSTFGDYPWNITGDNLNSLFIANQKSGEISIFKMLDDCNIKFEKKIKKLGVNNILII